MHSKTAYIYIRTYVYIYTHVYTYIHHFYTRWAKLFEYGSNNTFSLDSKVRGWIVVLDLRINGLELGSMAKLFG